MPQFYLGCCNWNLWIFSSKLLNIANTFSCCGCPYYMGEGRVKKKTITIVQSTFFFWISNPIYISVINKHRIDDPIIYPLQNKHKRMTNNLTIKPTNCKYWAQFHLIINLTKSITVSNGAIFSTRYWPNKNPQKLFNILFKDMQTIGQPAPTRPVPKIMNLFLFLSASWFQKFPNSNFRCFVNFSEIELKHQLLSWNFANLVRSRGLYNNSSFCNSTK